MRARRVSNAAQCSRPVLLRIGFPPAPDGDPAVRNAIGILAGAYSQYLAVAVASGQLALEITYRTVPWRPP